MISASWIERYIKRDPKTTLHMKKLFLLLVLAVAACINITAQNFERAVPKDARNGFVERYIDHSTGLYFEKRYGRISSIYNEYVWVEVYDQFITTYVRKVDGWKRTGDPVDRITGESQVVAMGVPLYGVNKFYDDVTVRVWVGPQTTRISFMQAGMPSKNFSIDLPDYMKPYQKNSYPKRRHNQHPGRIR